MFIRREEKERRIIDLYYNQDKTTREIIKELRVSPNYVSTILKKEEEKNNSIVTSNQQQSYSSLILRYLPKHMNYFLMVRQLLKLPSY